MFGPPTVQKHQLKPHRRSVIARIRESKDVPPIFAGANEVHTLPHEGEDRPMQVSRTHVRILPQG